MSQERTTRSCSTLLAGCTADKRRTEREPTNKDTMSHPMLSFPCLSLLLCAWWPTVPSPHCAHPVCALRALKLPGAHAKHCVAPDELLNEPGAQFTHTVLPTSYTHTHTHTHSAHTYTQHDVSISSTTLHTPLTVCSVPSTYGLECSRCACAARLRCDSVAECSNAAQTACRLIGGVVVCPRWAGQAGLRIGQGHVLPGRASHAATLPTLRLRGAGRAGGTTSGGIARRDGASGTRAAHLAVADVCKLARAAGQT